MNNTNKRPQFMLLLSELTTLVRPEDEYLHVRFAQDAEDAGFDGVLYLSALNQGGLNLAAFDPQVATPVSTKLVEVDGVEYKYHVIGARLQETEP